jgi:hypothetical protein
MWYKVDRSFEIFIWKDEKKKKKSNWFDIKREENC